METTLTIHRKLTLFDGTKYLTEYDNMYIFLPQQPSPKEIIPYLTEEIEKGFTPIYYTIHTNGEEVLFSKIRVY